MILTVNGLLDTGECDGITLEDVRVVVQNGSIYGWLEERFQGEVDLSLYDTEKRKELEALLADISLVIHGREHRKALVENRGLCYLVALCTEALQRQPNF